MVYYIIACAVMVILVYIKVYAEMVEFKKLFPNLRFKKQGIAKIFVDTLKVLILFAIPIINLILFIVLFFVLDENDYRKAIMKNCESLL